MKAEELRTLLVVRASRELKDRLTGPQLAALCLQIGLPALGELGSKVERLQASIRGVAETEIPLVVERLLETGRLSAALRNDLQDLLWEGRTPVVSKRIRREVLEAVSQFPLFIDSDGFRNCLEAFWSLDAGVEITALGVQCLRDRIERHVFANPEDWGHDDLWRQLGLLEAGDARFLKFLAALVNADVRPSEPDQRSMVARLNQVLASAGVELREVDARDGYPVFSAVSISSKSFSKPKNIIFASSVKPDIRLSDAVSNNIEIVTNADRVLVFEEPIDANGLTWRRLQTWWARTLGISDDVEAKNSLYRRLLSCLPGSSPPQRNLFRGYYETLGAAAVDLPALLPEVWLHWDPKTVQERGALALTGHRMDFLLLLPNGARVVIEVDGKQHYSDESGEGDPRTYASMAAGDRELRLAGYDVYRFGGFELMDSSATALLKGFFLRLLKKHGLGP